MHKDAISLSGLAEKIMFKISKEQNDENVPHHTEHFEIDLNDETTETIHTEVYDKKVYLIDEEKKECFLFIA